MVTGDSDSKLTVQKSQVKQATLIAGEALSKGGRRKSKSTHNGVPVWYDCCSCEAEPYSLEWVDGTRTEVEN